MKTNLRNTALLCLLLTFIGCSPRIAVPDAKRVVTDHYKEVAAGRHMSAMSSNVIARLGSYTSHTIASTRPSRSAFEKEHVQIVVKSTYAKGTAEEHFIIGWNSSSALEIASHNVIYR